MTQIDYRDVQYTAINQVDRYVWEFNERLREQAQAISYNAKIRWNDLRFPLAQVTLGASKPTWDSTNGTYDFMPGEAAFFQVQMSHAWVEGSVIRPHCHWMKTDTQVGDVNWQLEYRLSAIGSVWTAFSTLNTETPVPGTPDTNTADKHLISSWGDIDMSGYEISDMLICKVSRVAATGTEYGSPTQAARLIEVDIHVQSDYPGGSVAPFTKA